MERTPRTLLMGFHCHQPVGNFESVLRHGCRTCYGPLLDELARFPDFHFAFHISGWLLEWIEREEKHIFSVLRGLARSGQAELVSAGFFEPILSVIPPGDAMDQITMMSDYLEDIAGRRPTGLWLTERIWDPSLVPMLSSAGIRYTVVDDNHLLAAGYREDQLGGYFVTETLGDVMRLYPISQKLRYATPFRPVPDAVRIVEEVAAGSRGGAAIVFDDGEKFGMWPETHDWVYGKGWLRDFIGSICSSPDLVTETYRSHMERTEQAGRAQLPPGSYFEMGEWTLQAEDAQAFHNLFNQLQQDGRGGVARRFLRGGLWTNFFVKYPESNNLHKKMLRISRRLRQHPHHTARRHLYMGQCNDAYWHGIFGGLYLPVLRNGVARELNAAESELDRAFGMPGPVLDDLNADGVVEAEIRSPAGMVVITAAGGQVYELSDFRSLYNLMGTLARRREAYHLVAAQHAAADDSGIATIHSSARTLGDDVVRALVFDRRPRYSLVDRCLPPDATLEGFNCGNQEDWGGFADGLFNLSISDGKVVAVRRGALPPPSGPSDMEVRKSISLSDRRLEAHYRLECEELKTPCRFAVEMNLHLPSGTGASAVFEGTAFDLGQSVEMGEGASLVLRDTALGGPISVSCSPAARLWSFPVHTVSQSEQGFDMTYQGSCLVFLWEMGPADMPLSLTLELEF